MIIARVINTGRETMLFSLGAHPGFCAAPGDCLLFSSIEDLPIYRLNLAQELLSLTADEKLSGNTLRLDKSLFDRDAIILRQPRSQSIELVRSGEPSVRLRFPQVPYLGLWCKTGTNIPYICIEPWYGVDDLENSDSNIAHKEGINSLAPGSTFTMELSIEVF